MRTGQAKCETDKTDLLLCLGRVWTGKIFNIFVRSSVKIPAQWAATVREGKSLGLSHISVGGGVDLGSLCRHERKNSTRQRFLPFHICLTRWRCLWSPQLRS